MISEGTNIPRLRVCCYLSIVTTELYFRQVLGRVLRTQFQHGEIGYFITPAHPSLVYFSTRLAEEIPHNVNLESLVLTQKLSNFASIELSNETSEDQSYDISVGFQKTFQQQKESTYNHSVLKCWYNSSVDSFGRFYERVYSL